MKNQWEVLRSNRGQFTINGAFIFLFVSMLVVLIIAVFGVMIQANTLAVMTADITRYIEIRGQVDEVVYAELDGIVERGGLDVEMDVSFTDKVQFGEEFQVTLAYTAELGVGGIFEIPIPLTSTVTGRGERYWK